MRAKARRSGARLVCRVMGSREACGAEVAGRVSLEVEVAFLERFAGDVRGAEGSEDARFLLTRLAALEICLTSLSEVKIEVRISGVDLAMASGLDLGQSHGEAEPSLWCRYLT